MKQRFCGPCASDSPLSDIESLALALKEGNSHGTGMTHRLQYLRGLIPALALHEFEKVS